MSEEIRVEFREAQPVYETATEARLWKIPFALGKGFAKAGEEIDAAGATRIDMPYARYLEIDWATLNGSALRQIIDLLFKKQKMMTGLRLAQGAGSNGEAFGTEIPAGRYVTTIHRGAYHKVGETYGKIVEWAAQHDLKLQDNSIEHYIDDPTEVPKDEVRTEVFVPLAE
jgi:GyrI-like small molecule binding domain